MTTDQPVSSTWYRDGINQNTNTQTCLNFWDTPGQHNVTYIGSNSNGSVSMTWNVSVDFSPYDVNQDGYVNEADIEVVNSGILRR